LVPAIFFGNLRRHIRPSALPSPLPHCIRFAQTRPTTPEAKPKKQYSPSGRNRRRLPPDQLPERLHLLDNQVPHPRRLILIFKAKVERLMGQLKLFLAIVLELQN
jgi:hypothetical protein